jgi:hypothetical protein
LEKCVTDDLLVLRGGKQAGDRAHQRSSHRDPLSTNCAGVGGVFSQESIKHSSEKPHDCGPDQAMAQEKSNDPDIRGIDDARKASLPCQGRDKSGHPAPWIVRFFEFSHLNGVAHHGLLQLISSSPLEKPRTAMSFFIKMNLA